MQCDPVKNCNDLECIRCGKCKNACPVDAIACGITKPDVSKETVKAKA